MKKLIIIYSLLTSIPALAVCPIGLSENSSCTESEMLPNSSVYENLNLDNTNLQPLNRNEPLNNINSPNNPLSDSLTCPFGMCAQGIVNPNINTP